MAFWVLGALFVFVAAVLSGRADGSSLIYAIALLAPVVMAVSFFQLLRAIFSRNSAVSVGQLFASVGAAAVIMTYWYFKTY